MLVKEDFAESIEISRFAYANKCKEIFDRLEISWDFFGIFNDVAHMDMNMDETRQHFKSLSEEMIYHLKNESLKKVVQDISSKAKCSVDVVIRNLFERTADIGFLATDDDIRIFINELKNTDNSNFGLGAALVERFHEYVQKYSVYHDIVLLDTEGNILARLDDSENCTSSKDPLITESLESTEGYVEVFRKTDLFSHDDDALMYAYRVTESNAADSAALGVLVLCFKFENEMESIFKQFRTDEDWAILTLLDKTGKVISTSDENQVRLGSKVKLTNGEGQIINYAGRRYIAATFETSGYQGFYGLGWLGHVMVPLEHAFQQSIGANIRDTISKDILISIMRDSHLFSAELKHIPKRAAHIQAGLQMAVWNGNVSSRKDDISKDLLPHISKAGEQTKLVFEEAIENLNEMIVASVLDDLKFIAQLMVNIMDRNLYERANDCRWWALNSYFQEALASIDDLKADKIAEILCYINDLYTVYTNLIVYDKTGKIIAVSNKGENCVVGSTLNYSWVGETLSLKTTQEYVVSKFEKSLLYNDMHTYIYNAAIRHNGNVVGGIGIIFDSAPQFCDIISDVLPEEANGYFGVLTDRSKMIISSTYEEHSPGEKLEIADEIFCIKNGEQVSTVIEYRGYYYAMGAACSSGYREYKVEDCYENDVIGFVFMPVAEISSNIYTPDLQTRRNDLSVKNSYDEDDDLIEFASFYICGRWYGVSSNNALCVVPYEGATYIPGSSRFSLGRIRYNEESIDLLHLHPEINAEYDIDEYTAQVVILEYVDENHQELRYGLLIDKLGDIFKASNNSIGTIQKYMNSKGYASQIVNLNSDDGNGMMVVLNVSKIPEIV